MHLWAMLLDVAGWQQIWSTCAFRWAWQRPLTPFQDHVRPASVFPLLLLVMRLS